MKCRVLVYQYIFETDEQDVPRGLCQDTSGHRDCEDSSGQDNVHGEDDPTRLGIGRSRKFKSLVSSRSALSRSLEGSTGPRIDHKSWWSTGSYVRRSAARSRWCRPNSCIRLPPSHGSCDNKLVSGSRWPSPASQPVLRHSDDPGVSSSMFRDSCRRKEKAEHSVLMPGSLLERNSKANKSLSAMRR